MAASGASTTVPSLPTLSAGAHDPHSGQACVMEYVSVLAGEDWSDRPACTHPLLAHEARAVNDELSDRDRPLLVPLIARLFGTQHDSADVRAHLRLRQAELVTRMLEPSARARAEAVAAQARAHLGGVEDLAAVRRAATIVRTFSATADEPLTPDHEAVHARAALQTSYALAGVEHPAEAYAVAAVVVAHQIAAGGECRGACGEVSLRSRRRVQELSALIDAYDLATGREAFRLSDEDLAQLGRAVG